jgi:hypothetical protein
MESGMQSLSTAAYPGCWVAFIPLLPFLTHLQIAPHLIPQIAHEPC